MNTETRDFADRQAEEVRIVRDVQIADKVVFIDGFTGNGKTMLAPIVGSLDRVELMKFNYHIENIIELSYLNALREDVAISLIRTWTDLDLYRSAMARETNFRYTDLSGVFHNSQALRYIKRLFAPGDAAAAERIAREKPILLLTTHLLIVGAQLFYSALGERLCFIEMVRHPLYLIKQMRIYAPLLDEDPRIFHQSFEHERHSIHWWAYGWGSLYTRPNMMDRAIYMIDWYFRSLKNVLQQLTEQARERFMVVPFEQFVIDPFFFIRKFEPFIGTHAGEATKKMMKKQNVPRKMYAEGIGLKIYRRFGWVKPAPGASEEGEFRERREYAAAEASDEAMEVLDRLCRGYKACYLSDQEN